MKDITPEHFEIIASKNKLLIGEEGNPNLGPHKMDGGFDSQKIDFRITAEDNEVLFAENKKIVGHANFTYSKTGGEWSKGQLTVPEVIAPPSTYLYLKGQNGFGTAHAQKHGQYVYLVGGDGYSGADYGNGGWVLAYGGDGHAQVGEEASGGSFWFEGGEGSEKGDGGWFWAYCGDGGVDGDGGCVWLQGGDAGGGNRNGGYIYMITGKRTGTGSEGKVWIQPQTQVLSANITDGFNGCIQMATPGRYSGAYTADRYNYLDLNNTTVASGATITDACVFRFDANAGTHKAVDAGSTKNAPWTVSAWTKINVNGTVHYIPSYTSKTSGDPLPVGQGGTGLSTIAIGSILAANTANVASAVTSDSGLKALKNDAGVISWNGTTGTGDSVMATAPTLSGLTIANNTNIALGETNGTIIGTASSQKLGFFNKTPVDQPETVSDPTGGTTTDTEARAAINSIIDRLQELGLIK